MERICEPELMEGLEQARAYGAADFSATDQALVERLAELLGPSGQLEPLRIVDLGCGPGNISFRLVERFARAQVLGLDGAAAMLDLAAEGLDRHPDWRPRLSFRSALLPLGPGLAQELAGGAGAGFGAGAGAGASATTGGGTLRGGASVTALAAGSTAGSPQGRGSPAGSRTGAGSLVTGRSSRTSPGATGSSGVRSAKYWVSPRRGSSSTSVAPYL